MTTLTIAEVAIVDYVADSARLDELGRDLDVIGDHDKAQWHRGLAALAHRAGRAERIDMEPALVRPCGVCGGVRECSPNGTPREAGRLS